MRDPWTSRVREGENVSVGNRLRLDDVLPGAEMPPEIRVGDLTRCHYEQRDKENRGE